jgi:transposase-like protein
MQTPADFSNPIYHDEDAARTHLELLRWPEGPVCPFCGSLSGVRPVGGASMGKGWFYCGNCQDKFTVRTGTVWERSHIPLHKWLLASRLMASSKKGMSAHQLGRTLGVTYKSAWFLAHRIREAMRDDDPQPLGGKNKIVEADETLVGPAEYEFHNNKGWQKKPGNASKRAKVITLVERKGRARSIHLDEMKAADVRAAVLGNVSTDSTLMTDEARHYQRLGKEFKRLETVNHSEGEYARAGGITSNTVEGFFSIFKRGMTGVYQHCGEQHLQRYLDEFDFRYSNRAALCVDDAERTTRLLKGAEGKRLMYRRPDKQPAA